MDELKTRIDFALSASKSYFENLSRMIEEHGTIDPLAAEKFSIVIDDLIKDIQSINTELKTIAKQRMP